MRLLAIVLIAGLCLGACTKTYNKMVVAPDESVVTRSLPAPNVAGVDVSKKNFVTEYGTFQKSGTPPTVRASTTTEPAGADRVDGVIDWAQLKADGIKFAYVRISFGDSAVLEPTARKNWFDAKAAGIPVGPYHYFRPSNFKENIVRQAQHFINSLREIEPNAAANYLPLAIDVEDTQTELLPDLRLVPKAYRRALCTFIKVLQNDPYASQRRMVLYSNFATYTKYSLGESDECSLPTLPIWFANYNPVTSSKFWEAYDQVCVPTISDPRGRCFMVQVSEDHKTPAAPTGRIDWNFFLGSEQELLAHMKPAPSS